VLVYNPRSKEYTIDLYSDGIPVMAVDILPAELPLDASQYFSKCLLPLVEAMLKANWNKKFEKLQLPNPLKKAVILYKGQFTPDYKFMENFISG
ncbi:MAG TPA: hypothetical protein PLK51_04820, partial [Bacteroidales bacterium]|nr:hypothetical protein [Bacteroidales bacterium]